MGILTNTITNINKDLTEQLETLEVSIYMLGHKLRVQDYLNNSALIYLAMDKVSVYIIIDEETILLDSINREIHSSTIDGKIKKLIKIYDDQTTKQMLYIKKIEILINTLQSIIRL
ncbi:hypothetical protein D3C87_81130 [compost metagenome]